MVLNSSTKKPGGYFNRPMFMQLLHPLVLVISHLNALSLFEFVQRVSILRSVRMLKCLFWRLYVLAKQDLQKATSDEKVETLTTLYIQCTDCKQRPT